VKYLQTSAAVEMMCFPTSGLRTVIIFVLVPVPTPVLEIFSVLVLVLLRFYFFPFNLVLGSIPAL